MYTNTKVPHSKFQPGVSVVAKAGEGRSAPGGTFTGAALWAML